MPAAPFTFFGERALRRCLRGALSAAALGLALAARAAVPLADTPLPSVGSALAGNLAMLLSVEYPTAVSVAHTNRTYTAASQYLGYFDSEKCYTYTYSSSDSTSAPNVAAPASYFAPAGAAAAHLCNQGSATGQWSGNFLNWASMQTIDTFRWALTGGYRVIDTTTATVIEKAWGSGQGGASNFPDSSLAAADIAGATPFGGSNRSGMSIRIQGLGNKMRFSVGQRQAYSVKYYNNTGQTGTPVLTRTEYDTNSIQGGASPGPGVNSSNFSATYTATLSAPKAGNYQFSTVSDDGVRLWINGTKVIDNWTNHAAVTDTSAVIALTAGQSISVQIDYFQGGGGAALKLNWLLPGSSQWTEFGGPASVNDNGQSWTASGTPDPALAYEVFIRAKVCDPLAGGTLETNCKAYGGGSYKPEGLMQQYASRIRYSVFGYLNDSNIQRDGGVLRAQQKFIGSTYPVPGLPDATNTAAEWNASTGIYVANPDSADATATSSLIGSTISNSGVLNYINKFGEISRSGYKTFDPVGELYYAAIRYYKNLGNVAAWSDMGGASTATKAVLSDGFPVITGWRDPIQYTCQRNFILGIGDVNTHADKDVPGPTASQNEPTKPSEVVADTSVDAVAATNKVGAMQGLGANFGSVQNYPDCCNNNSPLMAGLAYDSNTNDIRPDLANPRGSIGQTVQTFWVDVMEGQVFKADNQFYLAAKYGGFKVPADFKPYAADAALQTSWWNTSSDVLVDTRSTPNPTEPRPDNYFPAGRPDQMVTGLQKAFVNIVSQLKTVTTSFGTTQRQVASTGVASYSASFDGENNAWNGELQAKNLSFASDGTPSSSGQWSASDKLATQLAGTGWDTGRRVFTASGGVGAPFRAGSLSSSQLTALDTSYRSGNDSSDYLNYVRGDRSQEQGSTVTGSSKAYRTRTLLLGDIVASKPVAVAAPSFAYTDAFNPGYSAFKTSNASRPTVVYVGANDGMVHAFDGSVGGSTSGQELFAYIPSAAITGPSGTPSVDGLASRGNPTLDHRFLVNGPLAYADLDLGRTYSGGAIGTSTNWASMVFGGLGKGGKSVFALNVTNASAMTTETEAAAATRLKWEFTDSKLGFTYGEPLIVKTRKYGWTMIVPSGYGNADGVGYIFFVNPATGALLERVSTGAGDTTNEAGLAQIDAYALDFADGTIDAVYGGDLLGNLWRFDVSGTSGSYPAPVKLATLANAAGQAEPVTSKPLIELHPKTKKRMVLIGTGRQLAQSDLSTTQEQSFYAIADGDAVSFNKLPLPSGVSYPLTRANLSANTSINGIADNPVTSLGWYADLGKADSNVAWRVIFKPQMFFGSVAFAPTASVLTDACNPTGKSRIYAYDFSTGKSKITVDGAFAPYWDKTDGVVTDLQFLSVDGTVRLIGGSSTGATDNVTGQFGNSVNVRRLNWRELPMAN